MKGILDRFCPSWVREIIICASICLGTVLYIQPLIRDLRESRDPNWTERQCYLDILEMDRKASKENFSGNLEPVDSPEKFLAMRPDGKYILTKDLDFNEREITPIEEFNGELFGGYNNAGKKSHIKNVRFKKGLESAAIFRKLGKNAVVHSINVTSSVP